VVKKLLDLFLLATFEEIVDIIFQMTAGAIAVPTVVPLRMPTAGVPKNHIDSNTLIEIHSGTFLHLTC